MDIIFKVLRYLKKYSNLIKTVIFVALFIFCISQTVQINNYKSSYEEKVTSGSILQDELDTLKKQNEDLHNTVSDYESTIAEKDTEIHQLQEECANLKQTAHNLANARNGEFVADGNYDQARQVWNYLRDLGLNQYVCAGIIGNIMAEVGGQTLDISRWPIYSQNGYYGICQWSSGRKERLLNDFGTTLKDQIRFLSVELFEVIVEEV